MTTAGAEPVFIFPDTNIFINFAVVQGIETLNQAVGSNGCWTETVFSETKYMAQMMPELNEVFGFMPVEPHQPNGAEMLHAEQIRQAFAAPGDGRRKHLGEAETMAIILNRYQGSGVVFITEDLRVVDECRRRNIKTAGTRTILQALALKGRIGWDQANVLASGMLAAGRPVWGYPPRINPSMPTALRPK